MIIHPPEKRKDYYVSRVTKDAKKNQSFTIRIDGAKMISVHELTDDNGYLVKMWIPPDNGACDIIQDVDKLCIDTSLLKNNEWFANALSADKIYDYFRPSINQQISTIIVSNVKPPRSVSFCGEELNDFSVVGHKNMRELRSMLCNCVLEIQGLYFYPKKFGVRWIIRDIDIYDPTRQYSDNDEDSGIVERDDIEDFWRNEIKEVVSMIDEDMSKLEEKIGKLVEFKEDIVETLKTALSENSCNPAWEEALDALKSKIFCYKSGRL